MSLDIKIDSDNSQGSKQIKIDLGTHSVMMAELLQVDFPKIKKMDDFFAKTEYDPSELPHLIKEIDRLIPKFSNDKGILEFERGIKIFNEMSWLDWGCDFKAIVADIKSFLVCLKELAGEAIKQKKKIITIPD